MIGTDTGRRRIAKLAEFSHENLLWLLLGSYAVAAAWPGPGLKARGLSVGQVTLLHEPVNLSLPVLTLALDREPRRQAVPDPDRILP